MADMTWYSREGADSRFLTKQAAAALATEQARADGDRALGARIDQVKATADAALPKSQAPDLSTYATKAELERAKSELTPSQPPSPPDLSGYATKTEMQSADAALGSRIDGVSAVANAAATKAELGTYLTAEAAASAYATKTSLASYLPSETAERTYSTKDALSTAESSLRSSISSVESALAQKAAKTDLTPYLTSTSAAETYAAKESLSDYLKRADAASVYATKEALSKAQLGGGGQAPDLSGYATKEDMQAVSRDVETKFGNLGRRLNDAATKAELATYATKAELAPLATSEQLKAVADQADRATAATSPFHVGDRYYSPVTYFWPDYYKAAQGDSKWSKILAFAGSLGIVILNRNSGSWDTYEKDFETQARLALNAGAKRAVFYVKTQYLAATLPPGDEGRNNIPNVDKYTPEYILKQLEKAKTQYKDACQGVFLDETITGWGTQAGRVAAYKSLIDQIRAKYGKDFLIVVNTGANISEDMCKLDFDVAMMFEKDAATFLTDDPGSPILPAHMAAYPATRWWAVVHGVTSDNYRQVFDKADKLGIAHLYITDGQLREDPQQGGQWEPVGNPYENPPSAHIHGLVIPWLKGYLPMKLELDDLKSRPKVLALGKHEAVPAGTPAGTIIVRKDA